MVTTRPLRSRFTLLWWLSPFRPGSDSEQHLFWGVTALVSGWLLTTVLIDVALYWRAFLNRPLELIATLIGALLAISFCVAPLVLKTRFPRWCGLVGYFAALVLLANNIFYVGDAVLATTALHILPVLGMYLGWFWDVRQGSIAFGVSLVLVLAATYLSPLVGPGQLLTYTVAIFTIFVMVITFSVSAFLSRDMDTTASTDGLTGALNARGIRQRLAQELARARRRTEPLAVAVIDFDGFKQLNDTFGHGHGDEVLKTHAERWLANLRIYDVVGRLGGDEFVLVFPRTRASQASMVLKRLESVSTHPWQWGLTQQRLDDTVDSILARADERLYDKKHHANEQALHRASSDTERVANRELRIPAGSKRYRQTPFSMMSMALGLGVIIPVVVGFTTGEISAFSDTAWVLWAGLCVGIIVCAVSIIQGEHLPLSACVWVGAAIVLVGVGFALKSERIMLGIGILYGLSAVSLYLGAFAGTHRARLLVVLGLCCVSLPLVIETFADGSDTERAVVVTAVVYAFSVCFVLFELSSYLYTRSRILVEHDALTGVLNRYGLIEYGEVELSRAERGGYALSAVMLDCVGFKQINDTQGHPAGDRLLADLAAHLVERIAPDDVLVRIGGDEFLLLFPYMDEERASEHVQTLLVDAPIRMCVGIAELRSGESLESLIERADAQLLAS